MSQMTRHLWMAWFCHIEARVVARIDGIVGTIPFPHTLSSERSERIEGAA